MFADDNMKWKCYFVTNCVKLNAEIVANEYWCASDYCLRVWFC